MTQQALKAGQTFSFITPDSDREAEVSYSKDMGFAIWFNGTYIYKAKSFQSLMTRFNKLAEDWCLMVNDAHSIS